MKKRLIAMAVMALTSATMQVQAAVLDGLQANYPFDVDASDATGNHDATAMTNGATLPSATSGGQGKFGEAFQFDHTAQNNAQWIQVPASATGGLSQFTFSIWMNSAWSDSDGCCFTALDTIWGSDAAFAINTWFGDAGYLQDLSGSIEAFVTRNANPASASIPEPIADGSWHHLVLTNDGAQARMYVDGDLATGDLWGDTGPFMTGGVTSTTTGAALPNSDSFIGANNPAGSFYPNLLVDDAAVWNRALSAGEVATIWNNGDGRAIQSIPEPSTAVLILPVLFGILGFRRRAVGKI